MELVVAAKQKRTEEILKVIEAGVKNCCENHAKEAFQIVRNKTKWHFIGIYKWPWRKEPT